MSDENGGSGGDSRAKRDDRGRWTRGNPGGPGRKRNSITEALRRLVDPDQIARVLIRIATDPATSKRDATAAAIAIMDRIDGRPIARSITMRASVDTVLPPGFFALPADERRRVLDEVRRAAVEGRLPAVTDHDVLDLEIP